jgi:phosphotransferase system HPr (HPr) family protein
VIERIAIFRDRYGLHPRSAHRIIQALAGVTATVTLEDVSSGGSAIDARSMLGLVGSGIRTGDRVRIRADGPDETATVEALATLLEAGVCHP